MAGCAHCDGSADHEHVDPLEVISARRRHLAGWSAARAGLLVLALAGAALLPTAPPGTAPGLPAGVLAWAATTAAGLFAAGLAAQRGRTQQASLALGSLAGGSLTPIAALIVAQAGGGPLPWPAVTAGLGWLAAGLTAETATTLRRRALLHGRGPTADLARSATLNGAGREARGVAGLVAHAVLFAGWVAVLAVLPIAVVALVPLHAGLVAQVALRRIRWTPATEAARLPG